MVPLPSFGILIQWFSSCLGAKKRLLPNKQRQIHKNRWAAVTVEAAINSSLFINLAFSLYTWLFRDKISPVVVGRDMEEIKEKTRLESEWHIYYFLSHNKLSIVYHMFVVLFLYI